MATRYPPHTTRLRKSSFPNKNNPPASFFKKITNIISLQIYFCSKSTRLGENVDGINVAKANLLKTWQEPQKKKRTIVDRNIRKTTFAPPMQPRTDHIQLSTNSSQTSSITSWTVAQKRITKKKSPTPSLTQSGKLRIPTTPIHWRGRIQYIAARHPENAPRDYKMPKKNTTPPALIRSGDIFLIILN